MLSPVWMIGDTCCLQTKAVFAIAVLHLHNRCAIPVRGCIAVIHAVCACMMNIAKLSASGSLWVCFINCLLPCHVGATPSESNVCHAIVLSCTTHGYFQNNVPYCRDDCQAPTGRLEAEMAATQAEAAASADACKRLQEKLSALEIAAEQSSQDRYLHQAPLLSLPRLLQPTLHQYCDGILQCHVQRHYPGASPLLLERSGGGVCLARVRPRQTWTG